MPAQSVKITSSTGGAFDCYVALPAGSEPTSAVVIAAAVHGVDKDLRAIADAFAAQGYIAAAPDLFWRTIPGPLTRADGEKTTARSQPRAEKIATGEADLKDTFGASAHAQAVQRPRRGDGLLLRRALRHHRAEAAGLCRRHLLPRLAHAGHHRRARRRHRAGVDHLGRRRQSGAARRARHVPQGCGRPFQSRAAHLSRHQARLHDAGRRRRLRRQDREFSMARAFAILDRLRGGGERMRNAS